MRIKVTLPGQHQSEYTSVGDDDVPLSPETVAEKHAESLSLSASSFRSVPAFRLEGIQRSNLDQAVNAPFQGL